MLVNPLALFGLTAIPVLLAVYLLRNRVKRREVSSLMLWTERSRMTHGGARLQRNQLPLLFFLELLILLILIWAAAGPRMLSMQATRPLTVILDNSASMGAIGTDGFSAAERALKQLPKVVKKQRFAPVRIIVAGPEPRWLTEEAVQEILRGKQTAEWTGQAAVFDADKALLQARATSHPQAKIWVISDAPPEQVPTGGKLRWLAVGHPRPNVGFINAVRSADRCMLELQGTGTVEMTLTLGHTSRIQLVELEAGTPRRLVFKLDDPKARFEASLPDDALAIDNKVVLLPRPERKVRVKLAIRHPELKRLVSRSLESSGLLEQNDGPPEILITDTFESATNSNTWIVHLQAEQNAMPFTGPFVVDYHSPLMEGISFEGLVWAGSTHAHLPGLPVVMAGNIPLLTHMDDLAGRPQFYLQIDPALSTLQYAPAWPTLFWNLVQARAALQPGFRAVNLRPGMAVDFSGAADLPKMTSPGIFEVESDGQLFQASFNFLDAAESDLMTRNSSDEGSWVEPEALDRHYIDLVPMAILAALALLALHQWLLRREQEFIG